MLEVFDAIKGLAKVKTTVIDNSIFNLHCKFTAFVILICCLIVTLRQYIGDPIDCMMTSGPTTMRPEMLDQFCWITTTFSIPDASILNGRRVGQDLIYPGVDKYTDKKDTVTHKYYQWVCFVLGIQALMFYAPYYLWKRWEGGRMRELSNELDNYVSPKMSRTDELVEYFRRNLNRHNFYFYRFVFCELLNFVNVVAQIWLTDSFLGGEFTSYGVEALTFSNMDQLNRTDPMIRIFPRMTKCRFLSYGPTGDVQTNDALCVLPNNIINEKIYIIIWFWFFGLFLLSLGSLSYRALTIFCPQIRYVILRSRSRQGSAKYMRGVCKKAKPGDWFVLLQMSKNIESSAFRELIKRIYTDVMHGGDAKLYENNETLEKNANNYSRHDEMEKSV